jgi:hypothetical protein
MQVLVALGAKLFAGGTTAAAAGSGLSAASILQGAATIGGVLASIGAGKAQAESYKAQAFEAELERENENAQHVQRASAFKRELLRIVGENDVSYAAAGIDLSAGAPADARQEQQSRVASEISIDRATTDARMAMLKARAASLRRLARNARTKNLLGGLDQGLAGLAS